MAKWRRRWSTDAMRNRSGREAVEVERARGEGTERILEGKERGEGLVIWRDGRGLWGSSDSGWEAAQHKLAFALDSGREAASFFTPTNCDSFFGVTQRLQHKNRFCTQKYPRSTPRRSRRFRLGVAVPMSCRCPAVRGAVLCCCCVRSGARDLLHFPLNITILLLSGSNIVHFTGILIALGMKTLIFSMT